MDKEVHLQSLQRHDNYILLDLQMYPSFPALHIALFCVNRMHFIPFGIVHSRLPSPYNIMQAS